MKNSRGLTFNIGDKVKFQYKIDSNIDTGIVKSIDGEYVDIEFEINYKKYICERYWDEIVEILSIEGEEEK